MSRPVQPKAAQAPRAPAVPAPCGGNVGAAVQRKAAPTVPAPCGGNVGSTAQPMPARSPRVPAVPAPCGGNVRAAAAPPSPRAVQPKVVQAKLVTKNGKAMSEGELHNLASRYPELFDQILRHQLSDTEYTATALRDGIHFEEYRPPSKSWHWSMPEDHEGDLSDQTMYEVAKKFGIGMKVERTKMQTDFTQDQLDFGKMMGFEFQGSKKLEQGKGLKESELSRNHHLSDSSIRAIVEYLYKNRDWEKFGFNRVRQWMNALTHGQGIGDKLLKMLLEAKSINDLDAIVDALSNNPWNVGIGNSKTNTDIGPNFDESVTRSGFATPQSAIISMYTEALRGIVPDEMLKAALNRLQHKDTREKMRSMVMDLEEPVVLGPGIYDSSNLSDRAILALFDAMLRGHNLAAQQIATQLKGDRAAILQHCRKYNVSFRVFSTGAVWFHLRGG